MWSRGRASSTYLWAVDTADKYNMSQHFISRFLFTLFLPTKKIYTFSVTVALLQHTYTHSGVRVIKCNSRCLKSYSNRWSTTLHPQTLEPMVSEQNVKYTFVTKYFMSVYNYYGSTTHTINVYNTYHQCAI